jgi:hypothetical protein
MNGVKFNPREGGIKLKYLVFTISLILFLFVLNACPPLEEEPFNNTVIVSGELDLIKLMEVFDDIYSKGIPVILDLSACTVPKFGADILKRTHEDGTDYTGLRPNIYDDYIQFDPVPGFRYGKDLVISIIVPDVATMICNAADIDIVQFNNAERNRSAFRDFTKLRSVTGRNIRLIGNLAFFGCTSLETVNFPKIVHILQYAFYGCTGLRQVRCEYARDILPGAFEYCTNLEKADFPYVGTISQYAFRNCSSLTEVDFPAATKIGDDAFRNCTSLRTARFHANPARTTSGNPLQPWLDGTGLFTEDSVVFYPNAFRGCWSLNTLDVRNAWNVYFAGGSLADIGTNLDLHLFDDNGTKSYGHPQNDGIFSNSFKTLTIRAPVTANSQIEKTYSGASTDPPVIAVNTGIVHIIRGRGITVNVSRVPALP